MISHADVLKCLYDRLHGATTLTTRVTGVFNYVQQDQALPFVKIRWQSAEAFDTKDSRGHLGMCTVDVFSNAKGDKESLEIADIVDGLLHNAPLALTAGKNIVLQHAFMDSFTEPDGQTNHVVLRFSTIVSD